MLGVRTKIALLFAGAVLPATAQDFSGSVVPRNTTPHSAKAIDFYSLRFQSLTLGPAEGPNYFSIKTPPVKESEYLVSAGISGIDAVASLRFGLTNEIGNPIKPLVMWKTNDSESDGHFHGFVSVPPYPFRFVVSGSDRHGTGFRQAFAEVIRPVDSARERPLLPPGGLEASQAAKIQEWLDEHRREVKRRSAQAERAHPEGLISLARSSVLDMSYEPF